MALTWQSRLKALRKKGLTLVELGQRVGLSPGAVSDIEQGRTREPTGDAALRIHELHLELCGPPRQKKLPTEATL
jgi:transcriptional regulator with XRE-family HTH domain